LLTVNDVAGWADMIDGYVRPYRVRSAVAAASVLSSPYSIAAA
jgi:hypothetical protein